MKKYIYILMQLREGTSVAADGRFAEMSNAKTDGIQ
jgi:hypothetical protein